MQRAEIHAFIVDPQTRSAVEQVLADRRLSKARPSFFEGSIEAATSQYEANPSPDLLVIETHDSQDAIFANLEKLSQVCGVGTNLVLIGAQNDVSLYRALTKAGVREYLPIPVDEHHLLDSIVAVCADPTETKLGRLVSFIGATGGAGSTTLANNVAWCLGKLFNGEVTLVDLDLAFGTIGIDFNLESPENSAQALAQADRLDDQVMGRILGKYNDNLNVLSAPGECVRPADIGAAQVEEMLKRFRRSAGWVVADLPHYWGAWVRAVLDASDDIVVTAVPTLASLRNAKSICDTLNPKRKNDAPVRVVLNHVGENAKTEIATKDFANALGQVLAVTVPHEATIFGQAANTGHMVGEAAKAKGVIEPLNTLATLVSGRSATDKRAPAKKAGLLDKLLPGAAGKILARAKA